MTASALKEYLAKIGRKGGKSRVANQTKEERAASARRAAQARWAKKKPVRAGLNNAKP